MNENQLKSKIFVYKSIDNIMILSLIACAIYGIAYAEDKTIIIGICLAILALVGTIGRAIHNHIAKLRVQLDLIRRNNKTEQQRKLMSAR